MNRWSINPFAIAELIEGAPPERDDADALAAFLTKVYQVTDLAALFDGSGGAPARMELFRSLAEAVRDPQKLDDVLALPITQQVIGLYGKDAVARVLPFIVPIANAVLEPQALADRYRIGSWHEVSQVTVDSASWRDPMQGAIADCYLLAAMIAVAWSLPRPWQARIDEAQQRRDDAGLPFAFYRASTGLDWGARVRPTFAVNDSARPVFARSSQKDEAWPALLEKAFVVKMRGLTGEPTPLDYQAIGDLRQEPQAAARMLAGGVERTRVAVTGGESDRLSTQVAALCDARGVTRVPVMAWTYDDTHGTGGLGWSETGLFRHHAYAVLGVMREDDRDFVVMRNPYGTSLFRRDRYAVGPWSPGPGDHGESQVTLNTNGVLAITRDWFDRCMRKMGWLQPASRRHE